MVAPVTRSVGDSEGQPPSPAGDAVALPHDDRKALEAVLHNLCNSLRDDEKMVRGLAERMAQHAKSATNIAESLNQVPTPGVQRALELSRLVQQTSAPPCLEPAATADRAVDALKEHAHPMHYVKLLGAVEAATSMRICGSQPASTFLSRIRRDARIRRIDQVRGYYGLAEWPTDRDERAATIAAEQRCPSCRSTLVVHIADGQLRASRAEVESPLAPPYVS